MTSAAATTHNAAVIDKLNKQHGDLLHEHETFIAALRGGAVDRVQPGAVFSMLGPIGRRMERSLSEDKIAHRAGQVNLFLHRRGLQLVDLGKTKVGYTVALTQQRILVFNFTGRRFLSQSPIRSMRLHQLRHDNDMSTLFFCESGQAVAITSWEDAELAAGFIAIYNRIQQALLSRAS
ncbi:MAG: hypothetical protein AAF567_05020 [Actinomycetota bacterium]